MRPIALRRVPLPAFRVRRGTSTTGRNRTLDNAGLEAAALPLSYCRMRCSPAASPLGHTTKVGHEGLEPSTSGMKTQRPEPLDQCPLSCPGFFETENSGEDDRNRTGDICLDRAAFYR